MKIKYKIRNFCYQNIIIKIAYLLLRKNIYTYKNELEGNCKLSTDDIIILQNNLLKKQVRYCYNNIEFYKKRFDNANYNPNKQWSKSEFVEKVPILEKQDIISFFENIHIKNNKSSKKLIHRSTSGSTGNPLMLYKDLEAISYIDAAMLRNFDWYGIKPGASRAHFWGGGASNRKCLQIMVRDFLINWRRFNCFQITHQNVTDYHKIYHRQRPQYIYGYAKCIYEFVRISQELELCINHYPAVVIVTGEKIYPWHKKTISKYFKAPVAEEYGCTECGVIAFECKKGNLHLMSDMLLVETVADTQPVEAEKEGTILLTELHGNYFPLLRYRIGDKGILTNRQCNCGIGFPLIEEVQGREDDYIICQDGSKIDAYCIEYTINSIGNELGNVTSVKGIQNSINSIEITITGSFTDWTLWQKKFIDNFQKYAQGMDLTVIKKDSIKKKTSGKMSFFESRLK